MTRYEYMSERDCKLNGGLWVSLYKKRDGTIVNGYCRRKVPERFRML